MAFLVTKPADDLVSPENMCLAILVVGTVHVIANLLADVNSNPFSQYWSEGNRMYDYSVLVDPGRYSHQGELKIPYEAPGRYLLWGIIYLLPNSPIWLHRLWDVILWTVPCLILGFILARWSFRSQVLKWSFALWAFLFLTQGPIYPSLILGAIIITITVPTQKLYWMIIGAVVAGYYVSSSRWTWLPACAAWAVMILISDFKIDGSSRWQELIRKLAPIVLVGAVSLGAGFLAKPKLLTQGALSGSIALAQPLLWYRLFPNATYARGILLGLVLGAAPLIFLLMWLIITKRWSINWLVSFVFLTISLTFLGIGIVISAKIGGGSNLHNLDMFLVTLVLLAALALTKISITKINEWPPWAIILMILVILIPTWDAMASGQTRNNPSRVAISQALDQINSEIEKVKEQGEILFIDQRQLITFGYIDNIKLVSDYEKKYMMDQAMAGNSDYFNNFYRDLASKRFSLIVSEPLFTNKKDSTFGFREENNAWVKWIARPLLCYYKPIVTISSVKVQLFSARLDPRNCPLPSTH